MADKKAKKQSEFLNVDDSEASSEWAKNVVDGVAGGKPSATKSSAADLSDEDVKTGSTETGGTETAKVEELDADELAIDFDPGASPVASSEDIVEPLAAQVPASADVETLQKLEAEKNQYLEASRRIQAEFENYRKQVAKREVESRERANEKLVTEILPVIDACDGAITNGSDDVAPVRSALVDTLVKQGLETVENAGGPFDPEMHEAVMHEDAKDDDGPVVAEVLRVGYKWKGRLIRPAMVKVRG